MSSCRARAVTALILGLTGACSSSDSDSAAGGGAGEPSTGGANAGSESGGRATSGGAPSSGAANGGSPAIGGRTQATPTLFWLSITDNRVLVADAGNPEPRTLVRSAGDGADGIAVDAEGGHVYWTNMGVPADDDGFVRRSDLDGANVTTIIPEGDTYTPKQLKIDPVGRKLYWSDREGMRVQRSDLDGSNLETMITVATGTEARRDAANFCVGLALDVVGGWFYWTQKGGDNAGEGRIWRAPLSAVEDAPLTRSDQELLYAGLPEPVDLELDVEGGYLYWTDRGDDTVNRAQLEIPDGEAPDTRSDREVLVTGVREAIGIAIDHQRGLVYYTSGSNGVVGRVNLDGSDPQELARGGGALTGITVVDLP